MELAILFFLNLFSEEGQNKFELPPLKVYQFLLIEYEIVMVKRKMPNGIMDGLVFQKR